MKKRYLMIGLIMLCIVLTSCANAGKTDNVAIEIGSSEKFSIHEIQNAIDCVIRKFKIFEGCELTKLWYDEQESDLWCQDDPPGTTIVLFSNFDVDEMGGDGSLEPNSTYEDWSWILKRENRSSNWEVQDWGY